jgi:maltose phosphorylase
MAGTWMSVVKGFGGMRVKDGKLHFNPFLPDKWKSYSFRIEFRGRVIKVNVGVDGVRTVLESGAPLDIMVHDKQFSLTAG